MKPKISVITVVYNSAPLLQATIDSIAGQSYPNLEYIVVDGGSTDGTVDIIQANADKIARWVSEQDQGIYDAMNKGVRMATGDWINFINAGDSLLGTNVIADVVLLMESDADIVYGRTVSRMEFGDFLLTPKPLEQISNGMVFGHPSSFVRRELLQQTPFDTSFRIAADYNFFYISYYSTRKFQYVPVDVALFDGESGISSTHLRLVRYENGRVQGRTGSLNCRIRYQISSLWIEFKQFLKRLLPARVVCSIRRKNMNRQV